LAGISRCIFRGQPPARKLLLNCVFIFQHLLVLLSILIVIIVCFLGSLSRCYCL
jgi:hypothetical protein